jgi:fucose permease
LVAPTTTATRRRVGLVVLGLSLAGLLAVGLPDGALGVAWPSIQAEFDRPLGSLGWLLTGWTIGYLSGSAASGPVSVRLGTGPLLVAAGLASILGYLGYTFVPSWVGLVVFSVVLGAGGGTLDASINAHAALTSGLRFLNLLHAAYGVGATMAPLLLTIVLHVGGSWRVAYGVLGAYAVLLTVGYVVTRTRWTSPPSPDPASAAAAGRSRPARSRRGLAGLTLATFFVYVGVEATAGRWSYTLFTEGRGMATAAAGLWAGAFWLALTAGRLLSVGAAGRLRAERLIDLGIAGMVLGSALLWWNPTPTAGGIGLVLVGLGAAPVFPTFVHLTPGRLGEDNAAHAIGYQVAISGVAAAAVPTLVGVLAGRVGLEVVGPAMLLGSLVLVVLHRIGTASAGRHASAA